MSKIGRKPIPLSNVKVKLEGNKIIYQGPKVSGEHLLPEELKAEINDTSIKLVPAHSTSKQEGEKLKKDSNLNRVWGLHRALLANQIKGAGQPFEKKMRIVGLGFKATLAGNKMQFFLGYSHKIDFELPKDVTVEIDKSGQTLTFKSIDTMSLGQVCSSIRELRPPEPYKGTGILYANEIIRRKAGKAKTAV